MYVHFYTLLKLSVWYLLRARLHVKNKKEQINKKLPGKECRMVYTWPPEFIEYLFFFLTLSEIHQSVGGKQMETSYEGWGRREREREREAERTEKTETTPQILV